MVDLPRALPAAARRQQAVTAGRHSPLGAAPCSVFLHASACRLAPRPARPASTSATTPLAITHPRAPPGPHLSPVGHGPCSCSCTCACAPRCRGQPTGCPLLCCTVRGYAQPWWVSVYAESGPPPLPLGVLQGLGAWRPPPPRPQGSAALSPLSLRPMPAPQPRQPGSRTMLHGHHPASANPGATLVGVPWHLPPAQAASCLAMPCHGEPTAAPTAVARCC